MQTQYVPPQPAKYIVRLFAADFSGKWFDPIPMVGGQPKAEVIAWVKANGGKWLSMWGSSNGVCDPDDDHDMFDFGTEATRDRFIVFLQNNFGDQPAESGKLL